MRSSVNLNRVNVIPFKLAGNRLAIRLAGKAVTARRDEIQVAYSYIYCRQFISMKSDACCSITRRPDAVRPRRKCFGFDPDSRGMKQAEQHNHSQIQRTTSPPDSIAKKLTV